MMDEKYLELFFDEVQEHIDDLNRSLLELEQDYENPEIINEIFRVAHTLKSSAGFVGLEYLSRLAHKMEDLFQLIKDKKITVKTELINLLFQSLDAIKSTVANIQSQEGEDKETLSNLAKLIEEYAKKEISEQPKEEDGKAKVRDSTTDTNLDKEQIRQSEQEQESKVSETFLEDEDYVNLSKILKDNEKAFYGYVLLDEEAPMKNLRLLLVYNRLFRSAKIYKTNPDVEFLEKHPNILKLEFVVYGNIQHNAVLKLCQVDLVEKIHIQELPVIPVSSQVVLESRDRKLPSRGEDRKRTALKDKEEESVIKTKNIRVSTEKIDFILNNVGELVITNSGLQKIYEDLVNEFGETQALSDLRTKIEQAVRITRELQSGVMKMRMMPVGIVFQRFHRPVRDLALGLGKKVELQIQGEETELDKNIIDSLNDPLMHLIRNAIDHGIEPPEERIKRGKPEVGTLTLRAYQSGNHIFIEVADDGRGLNKEKILEKARAMGLVSDRDQLTEQEIYQFIFQPGFSTAEKVSNVSGRGVGMNVVKQVVDEFKGSIQIQTTPGQGTSFLLLFPLTLAIISTIHVKVFDEEFAFPLSDVVETIRISSSQIAALQGKSVINLRKEIVPVYELSVLMGLPSRLNGNSYTDETGENAVQEFPVVITSIGNRKVGYIVDAMLGKREIVIKSLEQNYKQIPGLIGACLLGDGSIVMVLDVNGLLEIASTNYEEQIQRNKRNEEIHVAIKNYNRKVVELTTATRRLKKKSYATLRRETRDTEPAVKERLESDTIRQVSGNETGAVLTSVTVEEQIPALQPEIPAVTVTKEKEQEVLQSFKEDKERRKAIGLDIFGDAAGNGNKNQLEYIQDILTADDIEKLHSIINSGMINAGLVLTQLLGVTIDVSVPELKAIEFSEISDMFDDTTSYHSIFLETKGEFESLICLIFDEPTAITTAGELMGLPSEKRSIDFIDPDDLKSVLSELTNIVGSSVINEIANRTGMIIKPSVPEYFIYKQKELISYIDSKRTSKYDEKVIYITADFLREETEFLGKILLLPAKPNLISLVKKIKI